MVVEDTQVAKALVLVLASLACIVGHCGNQVLYTDMPIGSLVKNLPVAGSK